jgi:hypothetical protein
MNTIDQRAYEGDIVSRLQHWRGLHLAHSGELFEEAASEIARLRKAIRRLAAQDATLSVCGGNVTVTLDATLTDEERAAIRRAKAVAREMHDTRLKAALGNLLERTK